MWKNLQRSVLKRAENKIPVTTSQTSGQTSSPDGWTGMAGGVSLATYMPDISEITYFTVLRILSETMGKLPVFVRDGQHRIVNNRANALLSTQPNGKDTPASLMTYLERCRNHYGNAYAYVKWSEKTGELEGIHPLDPRRMQIWIDDVTDAFIQKHYYVYQTLNGQSFMISPEDVIHVKNWHTDDRTGLIGIPVRETLSEYMTAAKEGQNTQNDMYRNGMIANGVLNYVGKVDDDRKAAMVEQIKKLGKSSKIIPLPIGWQITPINLSLADAQYLETRKFTAAQVAAAFGVNPNQLNDYSKGSYANATAQQLSFLTDTLLFISKVYEEQFSLKLLTKEELANGCRVDIDTEAILRSAPETLASTLQTYVTGSIMTINEARDKAGLPPYPGGDKLMTMPGAGTVNEVKQNDKD